MDVYLPYRIPVISFCSRGSRDFLSWCSYIIKASRFLMVEIFKRMLDVEGFGWPNEGRGPLSYAMIRQIAEHIRHQYIASINDSLIEHISYPPLGQHWVRNFMGQHFQFKSSYVWKIEASCLNQSREQVLMDWLDGVSSILRDHDIPVCNVLIWMKIGLILDWCKMDILLVILYIMLTIKGNQVIRNELWW